MALSRRQRRHEQTRQEIKHIARQQMAQHGTAASLSLRAIAAAMGMRAPSLYNYYASRDDLLTDLLVDSYTHQAQTLEQASASCQTQETIACLLATILAYRQWANAFASFAFGTKEFPPSDVPMQQIVDRVADGTYKARPVKVFPFEQIPDAHRLMESNGANGKIVVVR